MPRSRYLVCYDICDPRRLRRVEKACKEFGTRIQYSIFECPLDELKLQKLRGRLNEEINSDHDQILFVSLGPESGNATFRIDAIGLPYTTRSRVTVV